MLNSLLRVQVKLWAGGETANKIKRVRLAPERRKMVSTESTWTHD